MPVEAPCANPLLLGWVQEWIEKARDHNSKGLLTYKKAYEALKACPVTFQHPCQLQNLKGFGPTLCSRLTDKLQKHCAENGLPMPKRPRRVNIPGLGGPDDEDEEGEERAPKRQRKSRPYVPTLRSGPYAIIIGLATLEEGSHQGMTKQRLIEMAQPHCDASFTAPPDPKSFYTAWNSMKALLEKDIVYERRSGPTRRYHLTEDGWEVARRIQHTLDPTLPRPAPSRPEPVPQEIEQPPRPVDRSPSVEIEEQPKQASSYADVVTNGDTSSSSSAIPHFQPIRLKPGSFEVQLLLDVREVRAKTDRDYSKKLWPFIYIPLVYRRMSTMTLHTCIFTPTKSI